MAKARSIRDFTRSEKMNKLTANAERLFVRLMLRADDFGNFTGNLNVILSECYPLGTSLRNADLMSCIDELKMQSIITVYVVSDKSYIHISDFRQRLKWPKSIYPPPVDLKEKSIKKENEPEVEAEVVVEPQVPAAIQQDDSFYKKKCISYCTEHFKEYFPLEYTKWNFALVGAEKFANAELQINPEHHEIITTAFKKKEVQIFNNFLRPIVKKEVELFWAFNDSKNVPAANRFKHLKLWLLRKK